MIIQNTTYLFVIFCHKFSSVAKKSLLKVLWMSYDKVMLQRLLSIFLLLLLLTACRERTGEYQIIKEPQGYHPMERVQWQFYVSRPLLHISYKTGLTEPEIKALEPYRIQQNVIPVQSMPISLRRQIQTGNPPDLFTLWADVTVQELMDNDRLMDLSVLLQDPEFRSFFSGNLPWEQVSRNGKIYGLPLSHHLEGLFYNQSLLNEFKWEVPSSLRALVMLFPEIQQENCVPFFIQKREDLSYFFQILLVALAEDDEYAYPGSREGKRLYRRTLRELKSLYESGAFEPWVIEQLCMVDQVDQSLIPGRYAFVVQGSWFIPYLDQAMGEEVWGMRPFPMLHSQEAGCFIEAVGADTVFLSKKNRSEEETAALLLAARGYIRWLRWLEEPGQSLKWADNPNANQREELLNTLIQEKSSLPAVRYAAPPDFYWDRYLWNQSIVNLLPAYLCGDIEQEELLNER